MEPSLMALKIYLESVRIPLRLACTTESGWPMAVSLWFKHQNGRLFCATQTSARVVSYLQNDPRCAFEIAADLPPYCGCAVKRLPVLMKALAWRSWKNCWYVTWVARTTRWAESLLAKSDDEVAIILKPIRVFTWDFSSRMQDIILPKLDLADKVCP